VIVVQAPSTSAPVTGSCVTPRTSIVTVPGDRPVGVRVNFPSASVLLGPEVGRTGKVECRARLGGMLNYYYRDAA
jgi:hypothetical protein